MPCSPGSPGRGRSLAEPSFPYSRSPKFENNRYSGNFRFGPIPLIKSGAAGPGAVRVVHVVIHPGVHALPAVLAYPVVLPLARERP